MRFFFLPFLFPFCCLGGHKIPVRLFPDSSINDISIRFEAGNFKCMNERNEVLFLGAPGDSVCLKQIDGQIEFAFPMGNGRKYSALNFYAMDSTQLAAVYTGEKFSGLFKGSFVFRSSPFRVINHVDIEDYVASVLHAEIGFYANPEFLKAKAMVCRTYGLSGQGRHKPDSMELCNTVHCQVYNSFENIPSQVLEAVRQTKGRIICFEGKPILTAFHANCGGFTADSKDGFSTYLPYLKSVSDSFCTKRAQAKWEVRISGEDWSGFISRHPEFKSEAGSQQNTPPISGRPVNIFFEGYSIPLKILRNAFRLRSAWFYAQRKGNDLVLTGRGYGHGVGFCQEGGMARAEIGFAALEIIQAYYTDVEIKSMGYSKFQNE